MNGPTNGRGRSTFGGGTRGGGAGGVRTIVEGSGIDVDATDPQNPIVSLSNQTILLHAQELVPLALFDTVLGTDFDVLNWATVLSTGTGLAPVSFVDKGGVISLTSGAVSGGVVQIFPNGCPSYIDNARTSPWYYYTRFKVGTADASTLAGSGPCAVVTSAPSSPAFLIGIAGSISATNFAWTLSNGAGVTVASGTGPALDTNWHTGEIYNNGTVAMFLFDGVSIGTTPVVNIGAVPMSMQAAALNGATNAARTIKLDKMWFVCAGN